MNYKILVIPHSAQRYDTVGDYYLRYSQQLEVRISDFTEVLADSSTHAVHAEGVSEAEKYEFLIMMHELVEAFLARQAKISFEEIDGFDTNFEGEGEPGDSLDAPYREQHFIATAFEKELALILNVDWERYNSLVEKFGMKEEKST